MQLDKQIVNIRIMMIIIVISISLVVNYTSNTNDFIFIPMIMVCYYIPFRFRVSLKIIYPRLITILFSLAISLIIYKLFQYYLLNFNILIMALLILSVLLCLVNFLCGLAVIGSIIIFSYCVILHVHLLNSGMMILLAIVFTTIIVLFSEYIVFRIIDCNKYKLINQDEIKAIIADGWERFNMLSTTSAKVSTYEINQALHKIEEYLEYIHDLRRSCIESFSTECEMITELENYHNRLSSIYDALSKLAYNLLYKNDHVLNLTRYDCMKQESLFN